MLKTERNQNILKMFEKGEKVKVIAETFNISESWVRQFLSKNGVKRRTFTSEQEYYERWKYAEKPTTVKGIVAAIRIGVKEFYNYFDSAQNFILCAESNKSLGLGTRWNKKEVNPLDRAIKFLYENQNLGLVAISKILDTSVSTIRYRIEHLGISSREGFVKIHPTGSRKRKRSDEFTIRVKRQAFIDCGGICFVCGLSISWEEASFHHKVPVCQGGSGSLDNCQPIHSTCHREHFEELHGFVNEKYGLKSKVDIKFYKDLLIKNNLL